MNSTPIDPQYAGMMFLVGLGFLVSIATGISTIISNARRKPPLDQEVYRDFVRREELGLLRSQFCDQVKSLDDRHAKAAAEIFGVLRSLKNDIGQQSMHIEMSLNAMVKSIGQIDGRLQGHIESGKAPQ